MGASNAAVRLQALDGTWETCGADHAVGVEQESLNLSWDAWGPKTASFDLRRPIFMLWPDIAACAPVEVEVGGVLVWEGKTGDTPIRGGAEMVINVQCEGWQSHLDDDSYKRSYVHAKMTDWKDMRSVLTANLATYVSAPQIQVGQGAISLTWPAETAATSRAAVYLDMGEGAPAKRVVLAWSLTAAAAPNRAFYLGYGDNPDEPENLEVIGTLLPAQSGIFAYTLPTPARYLFLVHDANSHIPTADETAKVTAISVFTELEYEHENESVLKAGMAIRDSLERSTLLLSRDLSRIEDGSFDISDFVLSKQTTPREVIEAANAYENMVAKIGLGRRFEYKPKPTAPLFESGAWSQDESEDASANSAAEVYNRVIVEGTGPEGSPVEVQRVAADLPNAREARIASPQPSNPSFDTNTGSWSVTNGTITRTTGAGEFNSPPASGKWSITSGESFLRETFAGLPFRRGISYKLRFAAKCTSREVIAGFGTEDDFAGVGLTISGEGFDVYEITWTPREDYAAEDVRLTLAAFAEGGGRPIWLDDLALLQAVPTVIDRRGFRRTKTISMTSAIDEEIGERVGDLFLASHTTTPFKGQRAIQYGAVRRVIGGQLAHPAHLGPHTQEMIRLSNLTDPDTGGNCRDGVIAEVNYTHADEKATVTLDDKRGNFETLIARLAVVQQPGS